jgi:hypothetical protein
MSVLEREGDVCVGRTRCNDEAELVGIWFVDGHERGPDRGNADAKEGKGRDEEGNEHDEHHARGEGEGLMVEAVGRECGRE